MSLKAPIPTWLNTPESSAAIEALPNDLSRTDVYESAQYLNLLAPYVEPVGINESIALEFGSGWGEGLIALNAFARAHNISRVYGSELSSVRKARATEIANGLALVDNEIASDGYKMLSAHKTRASLVVAATAGPSSEVSVERLIGSSLGALRRGGIFLLYSDKDTMRDAFRAVLDAPREVGVIVSQGESLEYEKVFNQKPYIIMQK